MGKSLRKSKDASRSISTGESISGHSAAARDSKSSEEALARGLRNGRHVLLTASFASVITFLVYLSSLRNGFIREWDDKTYVYNNPYIRSFDWDLIRWAFSEFYQANWHPLTWISHALDYAIWGLNPVGHHLTNNIIHAANTFLVVLVVARLIEAARRPS
ncbi:MAG TPA: hypothetical protein VEI96_08500, partial [Thermodesulfovibrionales bacterium]|nr:hypothetical protein [Thermodesulfovibrionales bacterium]